MHCQKPCPLQVMAVPCGPVAPARRPAVRLPPCPRLWLVSSAPREVLQKRLSPKPCPLEKYARNIVQQHLHAHDPISTTATPRSMFMCSLQKFLWQTKLIFQKDLMHLIISVPQMMSSLHSPGRAGVQKPGGSRSRNAHPGRAGRVPVVGTITQSWPDRPDGPDLVAEASRGMFRGNAGSELHGAGALAGASVSRDSLGRGRVSLRLPLQEKIRVPGSPQGLAPRLSVPRREGGQRQGSHLEPSWSPACPGGGAGLRGHVSPAPDPCPRPLPVPMGRRLRALPNKRPWSQGASAGVAADVEGSSRPGLGTHLRSPP